MKKYILLICLLAIQLVGLLAQTDSIANKATIKHNKWPKFYGNKDDSIMCENTLNNAEFVITPGTTVKVIFQLGNREMIRGSYVPKDTIAIFFCKRTSELKKYLKELDLDNKSNLLILGGYNEMRSQWYNMIKINGHPSGLRMDFGSNANAYNYLRARRGLNVPAYLEPPRVIPPCTNCITKEQHDSLWRVWDKQAKERSKNNH